MTPPEEETRYLQAAALLPPRLRARAEQEESGQMARTEELRLRAGRHMAAVLPEGERALPAAGGPVTPEELALVLEIATQASAHTAQSQLCSGFFTVEGGHRIGICGTAAVWEGKTRSLRHLSSLAIRIAREIPGVSRPILDELWEEGRLQSTLVTAPPGGGKTTLLRDLIRNISDGTGGPPLRVGVADERGELAAMHGGLPQFSVGQRTDVMDGCPKGQALMMLLRGLNPQVLAADEITAPEDCAALEQAANCGVALLCSAHGWDREDLERRPLYQKLLERRIFRRLVVIRGEGRRRSYRVDRLC